jgi:hypothetical protein
MDHRKRVAAAQRIRAELEEDLRRRAEHGAEEHQSDGLARAEVKRLVFLHGDLW